jgi:hypothetical protein
MQEIILNSFQESFRQKILNKWLFKTFMFAKLPMAWFAGLSASKLTANETHVTVKYKWITQNPFKSIYFAVLSMAAEMSTGLPVMMYIQDEQLKISMLVTGCEAIFTKKAIGLITFKCIDGSLVSESVKKAINTKEGVDMILESKGYDQSNNEVATFKFRWSIKVK